MRRTNRTEARRAARAADRALRRAQERQRNLRRARGAVRCFERDVVLVAVPFVDGSGSKLRPAVVIGVWGDHVEIVPLGTIRGSTSSAMHPIEDWEQAGLSRPSFARSLMGAKTGDILDLVGRVTEYDWRRTVIWAHRQRPAAKKSTVTHQNPNPRVTAPPLSLTKIQGAA